MGKSPGKWLKSIIFGKKSLRSSSTKQRKDSLKSSNEKGINNNNENNKGKEDPLGQNSPVISEPVLVNTYNPSTIPILEDSKSSNLDNISPINENNMDLENDKLRENQAATKAQAAFKGFLARRAFKALKGIIRLQALVRGYLVRRQAISTLYTMNGIVKIQALARGRIIRRSDIGLQVKYSTPYQQKTLGCKSENGWKENFSTNSFGYKLIASEISFKPVQIQYEKTDPNSVSNWLERWEKTQFWKPIPKPEKAVISNSKFQLKKTKSNKSSIQTRPLKEKKQISQKNRVRNISSEPETKSTKTTINSEFEKPKPTSRRFSLSPSSENPKPKLENPKKSTKKVSSSMPGAEMVNLTHINNSSLDNASKTVPEVENSVSSNGDSSHKSNRRRSSISPANKLPLKTIPSEETPSSNGESGTKQISRRRSSSSFSARHEIQETESNSSASKTVPSYMASTASAKARIKSQVSDSPRVHSPTESEGKIGILRRHSLPTSNGKVKSVSPRTRDSGSKGVVVKGERSLALSREGSGEKMMNAEWKR